MIFSFSGNVSEMDKLFKVLDYFCEINNVPEATICKLKIIVDEIVSNVINYSIQTSKISVFITRKNRDIKMRIIDFGQEFNPLLVEMPNINLELEDRKVGGLGIFLVKEYAKTIHYKRKQSKNILTVVLKMR